MSLRIACCLALALIGGGCAMNKPMRVQMTGDVTTHMPTENTATMIRAKALPRQTDPCAGPKVAIIDIDGLLVNQNLRGMSSMGENPVGLFREKLDAAAADPCVQAIVLRIQSPGGGVTASDIMRHDLVRFRQRKPIPVIACLLDVGAGGAYYIATAADSIIAHPTSVTGGVGVILNLYNLEDAMAQQNVVGVPVKSGEKVDIGTPIRAIPAEDRLLLEQMAQEFHQRFRDTVEQTRPNLPIVRDTVFDGRVFTAKQALDLGLIDGIGYLDEAIEAASQAAGIAGQAKTILFRRQNDRALSPYDVTPNTPLQGQLFPMNVPGLERSHLPTFLYMWQADPSFVTSRGAK